MSKDIQTFIIWKNARAFEEDILNKIKSNFTILKEYEITWTPELFGENLSAFYGDNFIYNMFQRQVRGEGAFVFVIAEDKNPNYITVTANRGEVQVNEKAFRLKQEVRELLKTFSFHSSNDIQEARHNIALLLGKNLNDFLSSVELDGEREIIHQDIPSARGWKSLSEFFYILNETCNYVLLRSFDAIPDSHTYDKNGDVDLLVDDMKKFLAILNPTIPTHKNAFHFFNWEDFGEDNKHLLIHPKFVGDNYYDINMQKKILETRRLNKKGVYVPSDEMYFWTLLHHGIFHKENWQKYDSIFKELAPKINVEYKADKEYLCQLMTNYMKNNNYKVDWHLDNGAASLMPHNIKDYSILKKEPVFYCYNNSPFRFVVFSERAIFLEPELVTEFINQHDIFPDLERHILDKNSNIYKYVCNKNQEEEYLWSFARRKDNFGVFSYKNSKGKKTFDKEILSGKDKFQTSFIKYKEQTDICYIDCKTKVEDKLITNYIKIGYNEFLSELDRFLSDAFFKYELIENKDFLNPIAWDYLPRNVFYNTLTNNCSEYIFFDNEAEYNKPIKKSQYLANVILELERALFLNEESLYKLYEYFTDKYRLDNIWEWAKYQREREINEILFSNSDKVCFEQMETILAHPYNCILDESKNHILAKKYPELENSDYDSLKPKLSVIIPIYNCAKLLPATLDCILNQTVKNIEIICVNDGSTDNTVDVLEEYSKKDERINVLHKENGGQASARNRGLDVAKGEFIGFMDSDDLIPENYYEELLKAAINENADISQCRYWMVREDDGSKEPWILNSMIMSHESRNTYFKNKLVLAYASGVVWNKVYRSEILKTIRFAEHTSPWEDNPFVVEAFLNAKKIVSTPNVYHNYIQRNCSSIHEPNPRVHFQLLKSTEYLIDYLNNPKNKISKDDYTEFYPQIINRMNHEYCQAFSNHKMNKKDKKRYSALHHRLFFKIKYLPLTDKLNCTSEIFTLKKHLRHFLKPFQIIEFFFRFIKNILLFPYYFIKEEVLNK